MNAQRSRPLEVGLYLATFDQPWANTAIPRWVDLAAAARRAEEVGFDSLWIPDHLLIRDDDMALGVWEGWSLLAALAASTQRITLGMLVMATAFRNPALIAKMADTVDEISGGRFILGLGAGWHEPEFRAYGFPYEDRVARFAEALAIISHLLRHGRIDHAGTYYQARDCELRPRGPRPLGPPIMVGGSGPRMLRLAARYADIWNRDFDKVNPDVTPYSPEDLAAWGARVDAACAAVGRDPATLERTAAVFVDLPIGSGREGWGALRGSPHELAEALRNYADAGFSHVQLWLEPGALAGIEAFGEVLAILDAGDSGGAELAGTNAG
jgi:alkanesulfonate monooxygenase SsuD/methylene tetrahydromethanopterin reductase-like flavin-dependent oxidoreductase (luciferase family)